jgi:predicted TPR repeat methyltransferase
MTDEDLDQLREQSQRGSRLQESGGSEAALVDELVTALSEIEAGDRRKTIAVRDKPVAALLKTLDENPDEMAAVGQALQQTLGRDTDDEFDRSEISRLVFRVGLQEAAPEYMEQLQEAHAEHMKDQL